MSLLLKALKQAEAAKAAEPELPREVDRASEPAPLPQREAERAREWIEPPGLLFGNAAQGSPPASRLAWQRPALLPTLAVLATLGALVYVVYVYFALQPTGPAAPTGAQSPTIEAVAMPSPEVASAPSLEAAGQPAIEVAPPVAEAAPPRVDAAEQRRATDADLLPPRAGPRTRVPPPAAEATPLFQPDAQSTLLGEAYAAYQDGRLDVAERLYTEAAARRRSVDALLGLAAIATMQNRDGDAQRLYREVLELDPRHALAQAALLDLVGNGDSVAVENRFKALIAREPTPQLYQSLGNHYAGQGRWKDAQAAYFEAYRGAPDSADYAYNLAVGLDRLHQYPAALRYYEKALAGSGAHRFDRAQVQARMQQLHQLDAEAHGAP
jgi:tetratricopeptide (TPR) repeat protein